MIGTLRYSAKGVALIRAGENTIAAQQAAATATSAASVAQGMANFRATFAEAIAAFAVGTYFTCIETGTIRMYKRTSGSPFYVDQGDPAAPLSIASFAGPITSRPFTQTTGRLIGRTTAATGAPEEISVAGPLTLASGSLGLPLDTDTALTANSNTVVAAQAAVKAYVDNAVNGLSWKPAVRAATTAAGTLATSFANGQVVDGVTLATGNRILIKNQAAGAENGFYTVAASGAPTRTLDADSGAELVNASAYVSEGTTNADTQWVCTTNAPITLGTTSLAFAQTGATGGAVTSVGLSLPAMFTVTGSPVTTSGTLTATLASQTANTIFAAPNGSAGAPTFRLIVAADLPMATAAEAKAGTVTKPVGVDVLWTMNVIQTLVDAATTPWDMSLGPNAKWTLAASRTLGAPTNMKEGVWYTLQVIQDATGSRLVTWPASFNWGTAGAPTLTTTAAKYDLVSIYCTNASTPTFAAFLGGKGF